MLIGTVTIGSCCVMSALRPVWNICPIQITSLVCTILLVLGHIHLEDTFCMILTASHEYHSKSPVQDLSFLAFFYNPSFIESTKILCPTWELVSGVLPMCLWDFSNGHRYQIVEKGSCHSFLWPKFDPLVIQSVLLPSLIWLRLVLSILLSRRNKTKEKCFLCKCKEAYLKGSPVWKLWA